ncbi:MAG TPA: cache domain-containing protein [Stellaceae bacterium]|nr:cache domain-containing protein [Stellaceae bacterium]
MAAIAVALGVIIGSPVAAQERGTLAEAQAMAERAAAHLIEVGPQKAIADFERPDGGYRDRDLFVVVYDPQHIVVSSIGNPNFVGRNATLFIDTDGKEFGKAIVAAAESPAGAGWVTYRMSSPLTHKVEIKTSYVVRAGDYVVLVGAYKP